MHTTVHTSPALIRRSAGSEARNNFFEQATTLLCKKQYFAWKKEQKGIQTTVTRVQCEDFSIF